MKRKLMHVPPAEVQARLCYWVDVEHLEMVNKSCSLIDNVYYVIACEIEPESWFCYKVFSYNAETDKLTKVRDNLRYSQALIQMGSCIE